MVLGLVHRYAWIFKIQSSNNVNQSRFLQDLGPAKGVDDERITPSVLKLCYILFVTWIDQEICRQRKIFLFRKLSLSISSTFSILVVIKGTMANRESTLKTMNMLGATFQGQLLIGCAIKEFCRSDRKPLHLLGNFVHWVFVPVPTSAIYELILTLEKIEQ